MVASTGVRIHRVNLRGPEDWWGRNYEKKHKVTLHTFVLSNWNFSPTLQSNRSVESWDCFKQLIKTHHNRKAFSKISSASILLPSYFGLFLFGLPLIVMCSMLQQKLHLLAFCFLFLHHSPQSSILQSAFSLANTHFCLLFVPTIPPWIYSFKDCFQSQHSPSLSLFRSS